MLIDTLPQAAAVPNNFHIVFQWFTNNHLAIEERLQLQIIAIAMMGCNFRGKIRRPRVGRDMAKTPQFSNPPWPANTLSRRI
jgi:hypothetical protein